MNRKGQVGTVDAVGWVGGKVSPDVLAAGGVVKEMAAALWQILVGGDRWRIWRAMSEARV